MKFFPALSVLVIVLTIFIACPLLVNAQTGIKVTSEKATLYHKPDTDTHLNISVYKGDIFEVQEVLGDWIRINLFSGGERYIENEQVEVVHGISPYPSDPAARSKLCSQAVEARAKASKKAMSEYPSDINRQGMYEKILLDEYIMSVFRKSDIPAVHYSKLTECVDHGILPSVRIEH